MSPRGWTTTTLGDVLPLAYGKGLPKKARTPGTVPVYGSSGVVGKHSAPLTSGPTLIVGRKGNVGEPHLSMVPCWPIDTVYYAEGSPSTDLRFFYYFLQFQDLRTLDRSTAVPGLSRDDYDRVAIALPPQPEQRRIVEAIDSYLSRLDDAVAGLERVRAKLRAFRVSVLKAAVEGRLVPTEASIARAEKRGYEPAKTLLARILKERRHRWEEAQRARLNTSGRAPKDDTWKARYEEPVPLDNSKLPRLPEGWCWTSLGALIIDGPQNGIYVPKAQYGEGTPILRIDDYQVDWSRSSLELQRVKLSIEDEARFGLSDGDLVLNRVNSPSHLGKTLAIEARHLPAVFESNMMRFRLSIGLSPRFLQFYLSSAQGKARLTAGAKWAVNQASINQQDVANTAVPLPPEPEQVRLVAEIDRLFSAAAVAAAMVERDAKRSVRLRKAVLKWGFQGKLVDQDPGDEPADKLVARIRVARAVVAPTKKGGGRTANGAA